MNIVYLILLYVLLRILFKEYREIMDENKVYFCGFGDLVEPGLRNLYDIQNNDRGAV